MHPHEYRRRRNVVPKTQPELSAARVKTAHSGAEALREPPVSAAELPRSSNLIKWPTVHEKTGKSRSQAWRDIKAGRFPAPVQTGPNSVAWYEHEIDAYVASRPRVSYAPKVESKAQASA